MARWNEIKRNAEVKPKKEAKKVTKKVTKSKAEVAEDAQKYIDEQKKLNTGPNAIDGSVQSITIRH